MATGKTKAFNPSFRPVGRTNHKSKGQHCLHHEPALTSFPFIKESWWTCICGLARCFWSHHGGGQICELCFGLPLEDYAHGFLISYKGSMMSLITSSRVGPNSPTWLWMCDFQCSIARSETRDHGDALWWTVAVSSLCPSSPLLKTFSWDPWHGHYLLYVGIARLITFGFDSKDKSDHGTSTSQSPSSTPIEDPPDPYSIMVIIE